MLNMQNKIVRIEISEMLRIRYSYVDDSQIGVDTATPHSPPTPLSLPFLISPWPLTARFCAGVRVWERPNSVHVKNSKLGHVRRYFFFPLRIMKEKVT